MPPVHSYVISCLVRFSFLIGSLAWHASLFRSRALIQCLASTRPAYPRPKQVKQRRNPPSLLIEEKRLWECGGSVVAESADSASSQQAPLATGDNVGKDDFVFSFFFFFFSPRGAFRSAERLLG